MKNRVLFSIIAILVLISCSKEDIEGYQGSFTDSRDGNSYDWIRIGTQKWMAENLAYLPEVSHPEKTSHVDPLLYVYDYYGYVISEAKATLNYAKFGVLYNWEAALTGCPEGWHLPRSKEWEKLIDYLINNGFGINGSGDDIAKSMASITEWEGSGHSERPGNDITSNNSSGFNAFPGGELFNRNFFYELGRSAHFWSSTSVGWLSAGGIGVYSDSYGVNLSSSARSDRGFSVRCIKD